METVTAKSTHTILSLVRAILKLQIKIKLILKSASETSHCKMNNTHLIKIGQHPFLKRTFLMNKITKVI